ncbi:MAG: FAD-binding protein [Planctomycetota bacterium]|jgi:succinate dehydrogenase/fumarate reductase flavoprotein subunit|nr:FAD-binding protein [Planctomycetota bacterium]
MEEAGAGFLRIGKVRAALRRFNTVVVGSGAAGLNAAECLDRGGEGRVAVLTEGLTLGTSRNTGSDKQTYYKLTLCGEDGDSVRGMARAIFAGGAADGDTALAEAALSARCFFRLVELGVPFPHNAQGEYVGYKTDHDPLRRGTSAGPLTSKYMQELLLRAVRERGIPVFDRFQAIEILTAGEAEGGRRVLGILALDLDHLEDPDRRYAVFAAGNVILATGGEAGMYEASVYPPSQVGSTGLALRAGALGKNLTESQFGLASVKFRWNLSGTYQQALPRYVSRAPDGGEEREFLDEFFPEAGRLLDAIFLKGYQWPFDPGKTAGFGSSLVDILVHHETVCRGRRVYLDYARNPSRLERDGRPDFSRLGAEAREYLANSGALLEKPIDRLEKMNPAAIRLYREHGIELGGEELEIAVSAQHNNGGIAGDAWWQSRVRGLFPVGEVNGSHGVSRPGGSALNAGQAGSLRAVQYILANRREEAPAGDDLEKAAGGILAAAVAYGEEALAREGPPLDLAEERRAIGRRMSRYAGPIRSGPGTEQALAEAAEQWDRLERGGAIREPGELRNLHQLRDLAFCQYAYLFAVKDYIGRGGGGRGSFLVQDPAGERPIPGLPDLFSHRLDGGRFSGQIQEIAWAGDRWEAIWRPVRPLPAGADWFETVWREYVSGGIFA